MSKETRFELNGLGPFQNMFQTYYGGLDTAAQSLEPFYRGFARWQLEAMGLISRRVQAYMEIPSRLGQCRTPQDFANEQARFWQTALTQYSEGSQRLMSAWGQMVASPIGIGGGAGETKRDRDYLTFPEPKAASTAPASTQRPARERRVA